MNPLTRFPRLNNLWMDLKHGISHRLKRRGQDIEFEATASNPRNVLVVVIDCLRADHVSGFGYERETTPALDEFDAAAFSNAKTPSTWTFPAIPSLLSGRYPHEHGGQLDTDPRDLSAEQFPERPRADIPMLPDLLEAAGYDTGMVTAIPMAQKAVGDRFQAVSVRYTPAAERVSTAREWIAGREQWFCYLHIGDPHAPLDIPDEHHDTFDIPSISDIGDWQFRETTETDGFEDYRDARIRAYDAAIRGADDALGELLTAVDNDTVVVISGDHGEAFWEHPDLERTLNDDPRGYYATDHGHSVLEEVARVPLWVREPNIDRVSSDSPVSLVDVMPTVLAALGIAIPDGVSGNSLEQETDDRCLLCEETAYGYNQRAVWRDGQKVITVPELDLTLAFDLSEELEGEPLEAVPDTMESDLKRFDTDIEGGKKITVDGDTRDRLRELGYVE